PLRESQCRRRMDRRDRLIREIRVGAGDVRAVSYSPDGNRLAVSAGGSVCVANNEGRMLWCREVTDTEVGLQHRTQVWGADWAAQGSRIVAISRDGIIHVWDATQGQLLLQVPVSY